MKGLYILWPDDAYITKALNAGVDTLLVTLSNPRPDIEQTPTFGTYDDTIKFLQKYKSVPVCKLLIPTWQSYPIWLKGIPTGQAFQSGDVVYTKTPCPTSEWCIKHLLEYPIRIHQEGLCDGIIWDFEEYGIGQDPQVLPFHKDFNSDLRCECHRCVNLTAEDQRKTHASCILAILKAHNIPTNGLMPYENPYLWRAFPNSSWWFNEHTYDKFKWWDRVLRMTWHNKRKHSTTIQYISAGLWLERFTANGFLEHLEKVGKSSTIDGIWIYPQARMSKCSPFHQGIADPELQKLSPYFTTLIDDTNAPESDPEFFEQLKRTFDRIDKYRKGWKFGIAKKFTRLFR